MFEPAFADIDPRGQAPRRVHPARLLHVLPLRRPTDELRDDPLDDTRLTLQTVRPTSAIKRYQRAAVRLLMEVAVDRVHSASNRDACARLPYVCKAAVLERASEAG